MTQAEGSSCALNTKHCRSVINMTLHIRKHTNFYIQERKEETKLKTNRFMAYTKTEHITGVRKIIWRILEIIKQVEVKGI